MIANTAPIAPAILTTREVIRSSTSKKTERGPV